RVYALAADGTLACLEPATGKAVWTIDLMDRYRGHVIHWGISESPLIDGDHVIVMAGGPGASIVALDKKNGNLVWKSQSDQAGYSSAIVFDWGGLRQIVTLTSEAAVGLAAQNGELLWRYSKIANRVANIATPIFHDGQVFVSTDYGTGCALLKLADNGGGMKEVYFNRDMRNHYSTSILVGDT